MRINNLLERAAAATILTIMLPAVTYAAVGRIVSGPNGTLVNGWYQGQPTFTVDSNPACPSGPSGPLAVGSYKGEGLHHLTIRAYLNYHPTIQQVDDKDGAGIGTVLWECGAVDTQANYDPPDLLWEGDLKWDGTPPSASIDAPANNSSTSSGTVQVTGHASDATSGVWTVTVNGVVSSISGSSFSANVPVAVGLNTLTAVVRDNAGNSMQSRVVVNRIALAGNSGNTDSTATATAPTSVAKPSEDNSTKKQSEMPETETAKESVVQQIPTPVKAATGMGIAGIGVASYLGFIPYKKIGLLLGKLISK